jgi:hypothetical protein
MTQQHITGKISSFFFNGQHLSLFFFYRRIKVLVYVRPHRAHSHHVYTGKTHAVYGHIAQDYVMQAHMIIHVDAVHDFCQAQYSMF